MLLIMVMTLSPCPWKSKIVFTPNHGPFSFKLPSAYPKLLGLSPPSVEAKQFQTSFEFWARFIPLDKLYRRLPVPASTSVRGQLLGLMHGAAPNYCLSHGAEQLWRKTF